MYSIEAYNESINYTKLSDDVIPTEN